jgi:two-component system chemotaxis sensor kinase CheA
MTPTAEEIPNGDIDLSAYTQLFLEQASSFLNLLRASLSQLQHNPLDDRALREARRATHTLKGMASTMRYDTLAQLAADMERPFLSELPPSSDQIRVVLTSCEEFDAGLQQLNTRDQS